MAGDGAGERSNVDDAVVDLEHLGDDPSGTGADDDDSAGLEDCRVGGSVERGSPQAGVVDGVEFGWQSNSTAGVISAGRSGGNPRRRSR